MRGVVCDVCWPLSQFPIAFVMSPEHRFFPESRGVRHSMKTQGKCAMYVVE